MTPGASSRRLPGWESHVPARIHSPIAALPARRVFRWNASWSSALNHTSAPLEELVSEALQALGACAPTLAVPLGVATDVGAVGAAAGGEPRDAVAAGGAGLDRPLNGVPVLEVGDLAGELEGAGAELLDLGGIAVVGQQ